MPNNNPSGTNGYEEFGQESPYGAIKRLEETTKAAPLPPMPGGNTPRRAQRRAVNGQGQQPPPAAPPAVMQPQVEPAAVWAEVAKIPGISPLVLEYAQGG